MKTLLLKCNDPYIKEQFEKLLEVNYEDYKHENYEEIIKNSTFIFNGNMFGTGDEMCMESMTVELPNGKKDYYPSGGKKNYDNDHPNILWNFEDLCMDFIYENDPTTDEDIERQIEEDGDEYYYEGAIIPDTTIEVTYEGEFRGANIVLEASFTALDSISHS